MDLIYNNPSEAEQMVISVFIYGLIGANWVICAIFACLLGISKGYSSGWAFFTGLVFGMIGLIYYAGLPDIRARVR